MLSVSCGLAAGRCFLLGPGIKIAHGWGVLFQFRPATMRRSGIGTNPAVISRRNAFLERVRMKAVQLYQFDELLNGSEWVVYEDVCEPVIEKPTDVKVKS